VGDLLKVILLQVGLLTAVRVNAARALTCVAYVHARQPC
jgi:hypothetical protein